MARVDHARFAAMLRTCLEREDEPSRGVTGPAVASWERGLTAPSATVLLAAADVAGVDPELLFSPAPVVERLERLEEHVRKQSAQLNRLYDRLRHR